MKFRGVTAVIRNAIANGSLTGQIDYAIIKSMMPATKKRVPNTVISVALTRMSNLDEVRKVSGSIFYTNGTALQRTERRLTPRNGVNIKVFGKLHSTTNEGGKTYAKVEVKDMHVV